MQLRLGYLCLFDNPTAEAARALIRQFVLVREADRMGFDDIWISEHHFDDAWPSAASTALLGHLAGVTSKARIGSAAVLPALRDPIQLAEDIATIDLLSKGRLNLGVASGGPFPALGKHFGFPVEQRGTRMREALRLIEHLLYEDEASFSGAHFKAEQIRLAPRPLQARIPTWIATTSDTGIVHAANGGYGLMAAATHSVERVRNMLHSYRHAAPQTDPRLVLARFCSIGKTHAEALAIAEPYFADLAERLRKTEVSSDPAISSALHPEALLAQSIIGSYDEVAEQIAHLHADLGIYSLALIPTSGQFDTAKHCLADIVDEIRPRLDND
jgi:alkanesulfonate monooxygenase SsuD/methylene tetrahydromethanopterin reductase-like flavin-dependent oxidoreductase (luciferase family)